MPIATTRRRRTIKPEEQAPTEESQTADLEVLTPSPGDTQEESPLPPKQDTRPKPSRKLSSREHLMAALADAAPALGKRAALPELACFWFDHDHVYAFDGVLGIRLDLETGINVGIPGSTLMSLLKAGSNDLKIVTEKGKTAIVDGRSRVTINTIPFGVFIGGTEKGMWRYQDVDWRSAPSLELDEGFLLALRRALTIRPTSDRVLAHFGVSMFALDESTVGLYTTDSRTLVEALVDVPWEADHPILLPRSFAEQVVSQCEEGAKLYTHDDCLVVESGGTLIFSNMISTEALPNLSRVVESKIGDHFADAVSIPARVREALDRAIIIAGGEEAIVTLDVVGKSLTINGALQQGLLEDRFELEVEPTFGDVSLPFRAKELKVALSEPADRFYLAPTAAAFFSADESYTHVVATHSDK